MSQFRRRPPLKDGALADLAAMFVGGYDDPTPGAELLDPANFDYTVGSLRHIDDYLGAMRQRELPDRDRAVMVLRCGAYVGEVIRQTSARRYHWLDYDGALSVDRRVATMGGRTLALMAILWDGHEGLVPIRSPDRRAGPMARPTLPGGALPRPERSGEH